MPWPTRRRSSRPGGHDEPGPAEQQPDRPVRRTVAAAVVAGIALTACTSGSGSGSASGSGSGTSATATASVLPGGEGDTGASPSTHVPASTGKTTKPSAPRTTKHTTAPSKPAKVREISKACPYISNNAEQIAEGKKVGRSTVLTTTPVGCRFYLAYPDYHAVAEITVKKYPTELTAFNTMARTGGSTAQSTPGVGDGAVLYRTSFYQPDGDRDWACIFAKGKTVVTVRTDATMSSVDARNVAVAIVGKF